MICSRHVTVCVFAVLLLAGCRTYGQYGAHDLTVAKISAAVAAFDRAHERAQADSERFQTAASFREELAPFAARYVEVVNRHGEIADRHRRARVDLGGGFFAYGEANRLLGAIVSEHEMIDHAYADIVADAAASVGIDITVGPRSQGSYETAPPFYERLRHRISSPSLESVIQAAG